jgi:hypothetical protein
MERPRKAEVVMSSTRAWMREPVEERMGTVVGRERPSTARDMAVALEERAWRILRRGSS